MLNKIKKFFKILIVIIVIIVILFGIYRREYLVQAIPVYIQYLEQRSKWEKVNTGTYVYIELDSKYYKFIQNNKLVKAFRIGNGKKLQQLIGKEAFIRRLLFGISRMDKELILDARLDARFDAIPTNLWEKLWDKTPFRFLHKSDDYSMTIFYNKKYGYPIMISHAYYNKYKHIHENSWNVINTRLTMFPKNTKYTDKLLKKLLEKYAKYYRKLLPDVETIEEVGGDITKGKIVQEIEIQQ